MAVVYFCLFVGPIKACVCDFIFCCNQKGSIVFIRHFTLNFVIVGNYLDFWKDCDKIFFVMNFIGFVVIVCVLLEFKCV